jgi:hypothetical protein
MEIIYKNDKKKKIKYSEKSNPELRSPLIDLIEELYEDNNDILDLNLHDISKESWYCINWNPILFNSKTIKYIQGSILTFHEFTPKINNNKIELTTSCILPYKLIAEIWFEPNDENDSECFIPKNIIRNSKIFLEKKNFINEHSDFNFYSKQNYIYLTCLK